VGFPEVRSGLNTIELCVNEGVNVLQVLNKVKEDYGIKFEFDEIVIVCNDKQLYIDEGVPQNCEELMIFPLALGGSNIISR
jgi:hypothetical protein